MQQNYSEDQGSLLQYLINSIAWGSYPSSAALTETIPGEYSGSQTGSPVYLD